MRNILFYNQIMYNISFISALQESFPQILSLGIFQTWDSLAHLLSVAYKCSQALSQVAHFTCTCALADLQWPLRAHDH